MSEDRQKRLAELRKKRGLPVTQEATSAVVATNTVVNTPDTVLPAAQTQSSELPQETEAAAPPGASATIYTPNLGQMQSQIQKDTHINHPVTISNEYTEKDTRMEARYSAELERLRRENEETQKKLTTQFQKIVDETRAAALAAEKREKENGARLEVRLAEEKVRIMNELQEHAQQRIVEERKINEERLQKRELDFQREREQQEVTRKQLIQKISALETLIAQNESEKSAKECAFSREKLDAVHEAEERLKAQFAEKLELVHAETTSLLKANDELREALAARDREAEKALIDLRHRLTEERQDAERASEQQNQQTILMYKEAAAKALQEADESRSIAQATNLECEKKLQMMREENEAKCARIESDLIKRIEAERNAYYQKVETDSAQIIQNMKEIMERARSDLKNEQEKNTKKLLTLEKSTLDKISKLQLEHEADIAKHTSNLKEQYEARIRSLEEAMATQKTNSDEKIAQMIADHRMALETARKRIEDEYTLKKANIERENEKLVAIRESLTEDQTKFRAVLKEEYMRVAQDAVDREKQILANARTQICDMHRAELEKFLKSDVQIKYGDEIIAKCVESIRTTCTDVMGQVTLEYAKLSAKDAQEFGNKFTDDIMARWLEDLQEQRKKLIDESKKRSELFVSDINTAWTKRLEEYQQVVQGVEESLKKQEDIRAELTKAESTIMLDARAQIEQEREALTKRIAEIESEKIKFQAECIKTSQDANNEAERRALARIEEQTQILVKNYAEQQAANDKLREEIQKELLADKARIEADYTARLNKLNEDKIEYISATNKSADEKVAIMQQKLDAIEKASTEETEKARKYIIEETEKLAQKEIHLKAQLAEEGRNYEAKLRSEILNTLLKKEQEDIEADLLKRKEILEQEHAQAINEIEILRKQIVFDERTKYENELKEKYAKQHADFLEEQSIFFKQSEQDLSKRSRDLMTEIEEREKLLQAKEAENSKKWLTFVETEVQRRQQDFVNILEKQFSERDAVAKENLKKQEDYINNVYLKQKLEEIAKQKESIDNEIETRIAAHKRSLEEDYSHKEAANKEYITKQKEEYDLATAKLIASLNKQRDEMNEFVASEEKRFLENYVTEKRELEEALAKKISESEEKWRKTYDATEQKHLAEVKALTEALEKAKSDYHDEIKKITEAEAEKRDLAIAEANKVCEQRITSEKKQITSELTQRYETEISRIKNELNTERAQKIHDLTEELTTKAEKDLIALREKYENGIVKPLREKLEKEHDNYEKILNDLKISHDQEISSLEAAKRTALTQQRLEITQQWEAAVIALKTEHAKENKKTSDDHIEAINQLQKANQARIDELVSNHDDYVQRLKKSHNEEITNIQSKHDNAMSLRTKEQIEFETSLREKTNETLSIMQRDCESRIVEARRERDEFRQKLIEEKNIQISEIKKEYEDRLAHDIALRDEETKRITDEMNHRAQMFELNYIEKVNKNEEEKRTFQRNLSDKFNKEREEANNAEAKRNAEALEKSIAEKEEMHKQLSAAKQVQHYAELQLRKAKHAAMLWRMDYHDTLRRHYDNLLGTLEARLLQTREEEDRLRLQQRQREASENVRIREIEMRYTTEIENIVRKNQIEKDATFAAQTRKDEEEAKNARELDNLKRKLREMWHELQTSDSEIAEFLNSLVDKAPGREQIDFAQIEANRLIEMLPIVRSVDQREFALNRLREFVRNSTDPNRFFGGSSSRLIQEDKQRKDIMESIKTVSTHLIPLIREYERKFERAFIYKGVNYLEVMESDVQNIERNAEVSNMKVIAKKIVGNTITNPGSLLTK